MSLFTTISCPDYWTTRDALLPPHLIYHAYVEVTVASNQEITVPWDTATNADSRHNVHMIQKLLLNCKATEFYSCGVGHTLLYTVAHDQLRAVFYNPGGLITLHPFDDGTTITFTIMDHPQPPSHPDIPIQNYFEALKKLYNLSSMIIRAGRRGGDLEADCVYPSERNPLDREAHHYLNGPAVTNILRLKCACVPPVKNKLSVVTRENLAALESRPTKQVCENCYKTRPTVVCITCKGVHLCDPCADAIHSAKVFQLNKHEMIAYDARSSPFYLCRLHRMKFQLYCEECDLVLCPSCTAPTHQSHTIVPLNSVIPQLKEREMVDRKKTARYMQKIELAYEGVQSAIVKLDASTTEVINATMQYFSRARQILDQRERHLLETAQDRSTRYARHLQSVLHDLEPAVILTQAYRELVSVDELSGQDSFQGTSGGRGCLPRCIARSHIRHWYARLPPAPQRMCLQFRSESFGKTITLEDFNLLGNVDCNSDGVAYGDERSVVLLPSAVDIGGRIENDGRCSVLDENGVMYYLGTSRRKYLFRNPVHLGSVVLSSSAALVRGKLDVLTSRVVSDMWTEDASGQCLRIEFTNGYLEPTHYLLQHGGVDSHSAMRSWNFEAYDRVSKTWVVLKQHVKDPTLIGPYGIGLWEIQPMGATTMYARGGPSLRRTADIGTRDERLRSSAFHASSVDQRISGVTYNLFQIRLTGPNDQMIPRPQFHIHLCAIELYGKYYPQNVVEHDSGNNFEVRMIPS